MKYRDRLTDDYLLLENGELIAVNGDVAAMAARGSGYRRTDAFDFRSVKVNGDVAYAVYFLKSDITDKQGPRHRLWLESMELRRSDGRWRTSLIHSTRVMKPGA